MMKWFDRWYQATAEILETGGRARTLCYLRQLDEGQLQAYGIAPELLKLGIDAWPWRHREATTQIDSQSGANNVESLVRSHAVDEGSASLPRAA
jgi:hypothetical protein